MNTLFLASFGHEALNNWALWSFTILFGGVIFFLIGLTIGRLYWNRFKVIAIRMDKNYAKRRRSLTQKRELFESISDSLEPANNQLN